MAQPARGTRRARTTNPRSMASCGSWGRTAPAGWSGAGSRKHRTRVTSSPDASRSPHPRLRLRETSRTLAMRIPTVACAPPIPPPAVAHRGGRSSPPGRHRCPPQRPGVPENPGAASAWRTSISSGTKHPPRATRRRQAGGPPRPGHQRAAPAGSGCDRRTGQPGDGRAGRNRARPLRIAAPHSGAGRRNRPIAGRASGAGPPHPQLAAGRVPLRRCRRPCRRPR